MQTQEEYAEALGLMVDSHKSVLTTSTAAQRHSATVHANHMSLTYDDLSGLLAAALERLATT